MARNTRNRSNSSNLWIKVSRDHLLSSYSIPARGKNLIGGGQRHLEVWWITAITDLIWFIVFNATFSNISAIWWHEMKKLYTGPYIDAFCQVWFHLVQLFQSSRLKYEKLTDGRRMPSDGNTNMYKAKWQAREFVSP
jgi:hypothetical protein